MPAAALAILALLTTAAPPPAPSHHVEDRAAFLTPATRDALDARLSGYERATGHQVIVWIDRTLDGAALDDWAVKTLAAWKLGRKGLDDGLAIFIFTDDRKIDIEVGYGLEDKVPDAIASRIIREVMAPRLKAGERDAATTAGVDAVLSAIEGTPWTGARSPHHSEGTEPPWAWYGILAVLSVLLALRYPRAAMWLLWSLVTSGRWGGGTSDFGGFRGGGGRSGGGGARGGW
jgi:uncharacterized protein